VEPLVALLLGGQFEVIRSLVPFDEVDGNLKLKSELGVGKVDLRLAAELLPHLS
jgi:hypothetical protein